MLWVYDKDSNEPRQQSPKDTAAINDLYRISHDETMSPHALENSFGKQEGEVAPILAGWRKRGAAPHIKEIPEVAYFIALLHLRNLKAAKFFEAMSEIMRIEKVKSIARSDAHLNGFGTA
jgi:hypothetical protein